MLTETQLLTYLRKVGHQNQDDKNIDILCL